MLRASAQWRLGERSTLTLGAARQLSDSASAAIDGIGQAVAVPDSLTSASSGIDSSIYEESSANFAYAYTGERAAFSIGPYYDRVDYVDTSSFDETRRGAVFQFSYRLTTTLDLRSFVDATRSRFPEIGRETDDLRLGLGLDKTWSRHWSSAVQYVHYRREDNGLFGDSRQNVWYLTVSYRNR